MVYEEYHDSVFDRSLSTSNGMSHPSNDRRLFYLHNLNTLFLLLPSFKLPPLSVFGNLRSDPSSLQFT